MKFDIVRAWKDETYRQSLSTEQLSTLPANPAGELNDADLATVYGGGGGGGYPMPSAGGGGGPVGGGPVGVPVGGGPVGVPVGVPVGIGVSHIRNESVALICEVNIFSVNVNVINILGSLTQICLKG